MPQEQTPEERRFERIEATLETLAKAVTAIATDSHRSNENVNNVQRHVLKEIQHHMDRTAKTEESVAALFQLKTDQDKKMNALTGFMAELAIAQTTAEVHIGKIAEAQVKLTESQAKSDLAQAETQGKLNVLIHMWDNWIVENSGKNGKPAPEPPPAA